MSKILVVDDDFIQRDLYADLFTGAGLEVIKASDGVEALQLAELNHPDFVFTGIQMPGLTGFELVEKIRTHQDMASVPVIIFSHLYREADQQRTKMLPNAAFKVKGYDTPNEILKSVQGTLASRPADHTPPKLPLEEEDDRTAGITF